jgi:hypothetical protein
MASSGTASNEAVHTPTFYPQKDTHGPPLLSSNSIPTTAQIKDDRKLAPQAYISPNYLKRLQPFRSGNIPNLSSSPLVDVRKNFAPPPPLPKPFPSDHTAAKEKTTGKAMTAELNKQKPVVLKSGAAPPPLNFSKTIQEPNQRGGGEDKTRKWVQLFLKFNKFERHVAMEMLRKYSDEKQRSEIAAIFVNDFSEDEGSEKDEAKSTPLQVKSGRVEAERRGEGAKQWGVDDHHSRSSAQPAYNNSGQWTDQDEDEWSGMMDYVDRDKLKGLNSTKESSLNESGLMKVPFLNSAYTTQLVSQMLYKPRNAMHTVLDKNIGMLECTAVWNLEKRRLELYLDSAQGTPLLCGQLVSEDEANMLRFDVSLADDYGGDRLCMLDQVRRVPLAQFEINTDGDSASALYQRPYVSKGAGGGVYASMEDTMEEFHGMKRQIGAIQVKCEENAPRKVLLMVPSLDKETKRPNNFFTQYKEDNILKMAASGPQERIEYLLSKEAEYDDELNGYCLDFGGRVTMASSKNVVLTRHGRRKTLYCFGKSGPNEYALSFGSPLSILQAFCTALSSVAVSLQIFTTDRELSEFEDDSDDDDDRDDMFFEDDEMLHEDEYYYGEDDD